MGHTPLPQGARVGRVVLQVADLARSIAYYTDVIGLRVLRRSAAPAVAWLGAGGEPALLELRERPGAARVPHRGLLGLYHFAILLPTRGDLGRFLSHLLSIGQPPAMSDHLVSEALYLWDPDGLGIEVYADRPRSTWRYEDGQLAMATEPLDAESVIAAGEGARFAGLPQGTVIGHVHLFGSNLPAADAHYVQAIGFDKTVWGYPGALFMSAGGYHHHLAVNTWASRSPRATERDARLLEWELVVPGDDDLRAIRARLHAAGAVITDGDRGFVAPDADTTVLRVLTEAHSRA